MLEKALLIGAMLISNAAFAGDSSLSIPSGFARLAQNSCTAQDQQHCQSELSNCYNSYPCKGDPSICKLQCCAILRNCIFIRHCDMSAYHCIN